MEDGRDFIIVCIAPAGNEPIQKNCYAQRFDMREFGVELSGEERNPFKRIKVVVPPDERERHLYVQVPNISQEMRWDYLQPSFQDFERIEGESVCRIQEFRSFFCDSR